MKYESSTDWMKGESKEIVEKYFKDISYNVFLGIMKFEEL